MSCPATEIRPSNDDHRPTSISKRGSRVGDQPFMRSRNRAACSHESASSIGKFKGYPYLHGSSSTRVTSPWFAVCCLLFAPMRSIRAHSEPPDGYREQRHKARSTSRDVPYRLNGTTGILVFSHGSSPSQSVHSYREREEMPTNRET